MNPDQRNRIILLALLLIAVPVLLWYQLRTPSAPNAAGGGEQQPAQTDAPVQSKFQEVDVNVQELVQNIQEVDFSYSEVNPARDPMIPPAIVGGLDAGGPQNGGPAAPPDESVIFEANRKTLTGIIWDPKSPVAVIDNQIVREGFAFPPNERIVVSAIQPSHVELTLKLEGGNEMQITKELKEQ